MRKKISSAAKKITSKIKLPQIKLARKKSSIKKSASQKSAHEKVEQNAASDANQQEVSSAKFYTGVQTIFERSLPTELPGRYHETKIVIQVRDPWWLHAYWEVKPETVEEAKAKAASDLNGARCVLRVYDVSFINFNGKNAHRYFDIDVNLDANNWYIDTGAPGRGWCVEIGFRLPDGRFIALARSNCVNTPLDGPSWMTDEEWMVPDDIFTRLYGMGFGMGPASPTGKGMTEKIKRERLRLAHVSSPALFSISSPRKVFIKPKGEKGFWLVVNTELIVYGATQPDAKVKVCGKPVKLKSDGTFSLRFALPDGKQTIPVEAWPADDDDYRVITPVVSKETK